MPDRAGREPRTGPATRKAGGTMAANKILTNATLIGSSSAGVLYWSIANQCWLVGSVSTAGHVTVSKYSRAYRLLQTQVINYAFGVDNHDVPSIVQMQSGKYLAVYNKHANVQYSQLTDAADDIRSWGSPVQVTDAATAATFQFLARGTDSSNTIFL